MKNENEMKNENIIIQNQVYYKNRKTTSCQARGIETLSISTIKESEI